MKTTPWAILQRGLYPEGSKEPLKGLKQSHQRLSSAFERHPSGSCSRMKFRKRIQEAGRAIRKLLK